MLYSPPMPPLTIAHRGARSLAPENTLEAARKAHAVGAELWETDVAFTRDERLILFHDDLLKRTTGAPGKFFDTPLAEILALEPGRRFLETDPFEQVAAGAVAEAEHETIRAARVPTLVEALTLTKKLDWRVNVELKRNPAHLPGFPLLKKVFEAVAESGAGPEHVLFSSAVHEWLDEIREKRPEFEVQALIALWPHDPVDYGDYRFDTYNVRRTRVPPGDVAALVDKGKNVNVYVVNEADDMIAFAKAGAAGLITDFPQRQTALIAEGRL